MQTVDRCQYLSHFELWSVYWNISINNCHLFALLHFRDAMWIFFILCCFCIYLKKKQISVNKLSLNVNVDAWTSECGAFIVETVEFLRWTAWFCYSSCLLLLFSLRLFPTDFNLIYSIPSFLCCIFLSSYFKLSSHLLLCILTASK